MRWNGFLILSALAAWSITATPLCAAASFGTVVAIGGHASDIALDESRGVLYIADFTANRIDVLTLADNTVHTSINVAAQPGALALSRDSQYLLVAHFNNTSPVVPSGNLLTLIHLTDNSRQTFITSDPPLGVAFFGTAQVGGPANLAGPGKALVVTATSFFVLDPLTGVLQLVDTIANVALTLPVTVPTFPGQILETALATSGDGLKIWGVGGAGTGNQIIYQFSGLTGRLSAFTDVSSPPLLPRVSVSKDGSFAMIGWVLFNSNGVAVSKYPGVTTSTNVTGHAIDSTNNLLYAQIPDATQPSGPPYTSSSASAGSTSSAVLPTLLIMDDDNLTVRSRLRIPEDMVGRAVLNSAASVLYAVSDSGVMVLPVGSLNTYHQLTADREDLLVQTSFCNRSSVIQSFTISDPSGAHTDFSVTSSQSGVTLSPSSGTTPAAVQVTVDPGKFTTQGTTAVTLTLSSTTAVNVPNAVRLLVNTPDQDQRGTIVDVPGVLSDILPDTSRNRYYILRQDLNRLLIFDGTSNQQLTALRTATTPTLMSMSIDGKYLLVAHDNSQLVTVYDLDQMAQVAPVVLPGGHYGRAVAASNAQLLVLARDEATGLGIIDTVNFAARTATALATLGVYTNQVSPTGVLTASPNGRSVLMAAPDGTVMLYSADADTFTVGRKDLTALGGGFAASSYDTYVAGNYVFNASLVPQGTLDTTLGTTSGFAFTGQGGYRVIATSASAAGVIQNLPSLTSAQVSPTAMVEAPLLPTTTQPFTRTVAPMPSAGTVIALTTSGIAVLASGYATAVAPPSISSVQNAADGSAQVAAGGLIAVKGSQMSPVNVATQQIPLPTALGQSCLTVNGTPIPLLFVSTAQVNAQLPFNVAGNATMSIHTPGGTSNNYNFTVLSNAPGVFMSGSAGPETGLATMVRAANGQLVTPTNPVRSNDLLVIYLTGLGAVSPALDAGLAAPASPLSWVVEQPSVTLGGVPLNVQYAGLVPGEIDGLYQINAQVGDVASIQGLSVPLTISQSSGATTLNVRVVK